MPEWQTAASGVLVAMGTRFCDEVMDEMLQRFQPGVLPHFFVVQTIGNLATSNGKLTIILQKSICCRDIGETIYNIYLM